MITLLLSGDSQLIIMHRYVDMFEHEELRNILALLRTIGRSCEMSGLKRKQKTMMEHY